MSGQIVCKIVIFVHSWGVGALCVEMGFTRTFPRNQNATEMYSIAIQLGVDNLINKNSNQALPML